MISEKQMRRIGFFRALFEADPDGLLLTQSLVARSGREIPTEASEIEKLALLSGNLERHLAARHRLDLEKYYAPGRLMPRAWLFGGCFVIGLVANYLDPSQKVNLLLNPMIVLILWNLAIYLVLLVRRLLPRAVRKSRRDVPGIAMLWRRCAGLFRRRGAGAVEKVLLEARVQFYRHWIAEQSALVGSRCAGLLHGFAATVAVGVVAGLYLRGLALEYRFEWQSTFITEPATFEAVMNVLFAPILGSMPGVFKLADQSGAFWIHLYALAALFYVIVPRIGLYAWCRYRSAKLARGLTLETNVPTLLALLAPLAGGRIQLQLVQYSYRLEEDQRHNLLATARSIWGEGLLLGACTQVEWGNEEAHLPEQQDHVLMLVFNGVQTPEDDVHGLFAADFLGKARQARATVVVVDHSAVPADNKASRREAWSAVLQSGHVEKFAWLDLGGGGDKETALRQLAEAVQRGET